MLHSHGYSHCFICVLDGYCMDVKKINHVQYVMSLGAVRDYNHACEVQSEVYEQIIA